MRKFFTEHPFMKLLSLILATILWFFVRGGRHTELSVDVQVQVKNLPKKFVVSSEIDPTINLRLVGPKTRLNRVDPADLPPFELDLSNARKGSNSFRIHEGNFKFPSGVQVTRMVPQEIRVMVEELEEKLVRIEPRFMDELDEGFELAGYEVTPAFAKKFGSRRELAATPYIFTEPISLAGRHASFVVDYSLAHGSTGSAEEKKVTVKVVIREKEIAKIFKDVPVRVVGFRSAVRIEPRTVSIKAKGLAGRVAALAEEHLEVEIDADRMGLSKLKRKVMHVIPILPKRPGLELAVIPGRVRLTLLSE